MSESDRLETKIVLLFPVKFGSSNKHDLKIDFFMKIIHSQKKAGKVVTLLYTYINDTTFKLSVFWPSDTESQINELRFSESVSLSFKTRLTSVTCFCGNVT